MTQNSTIHWQTGIPYEFGKYLITTKYNEVEVDMWFGVPDNDGNNLSLIGIFDDDIHDSPFKVTGCAIYSKSQDDVIILW